jgi:hypothetical protein
LAWRNFSDWKTSFRGDHLFLFVGHLDTYGPFTRNRSDDANAQGGEAEGDVIFQIFDFGNADARGGYDFVKGNGRPYGGPDFCYFDFVVGQGGRDLIFVGFQLSPVNFHRVISIIHKEIQIREFIPGKVSGWVIGFHVQRFFLFHLHIFDIILNNGLVFDDFHRGF